MRRSSVVPGNAAVANLRLGQTLQRISLAAGPAIYAVAFFMTAVTSTGSPISGWECARVALFSVEETFYPPLFASGLINPLAVLYLVLRWAGRAPRWRHAIAIIVFIFILLSWITIAQFKLTIAAGHVAWVAGLALIMGPEAIRKIGDQDTKIIE